MTWLRKFRRALARFWFADAESAIDLDEREQQQRMREGRQP